MTLGETSGNGMVQRYNTTVEEVTAVICLDYFSGILEEIIHSIKQFWNQYMPGILKCKKDKAYEDGQLCPKCTFPKQFQKQDIQNMKDISCRKPIIQSPLKQSINIKENDEDKEDDISKLLMEEFQWPPWNITLNLTDEHKNSVNLKCEIKKPTDSTKIQWNQISPYEIVVNDTISLDMECYMNRENYEKLWKLIAYYSEVPVILKREHVLTHEPKLSYHYRQGSNYDDAPYYTGVKGRIFAEPAWVMQPFIHIQLNRHQSTGEMVVLSFSSQVSQTIQPHENKQQRSSWVMIEQDQHTRAAQSVVEGSSAQLSCNVKASESPSIRWILPDGTKLKAPFKIEGQRFSVLSSGQLIIRSVAYADSGIYHCVAQVRDDVDTVAYRVLVQPIAIQQVESELIKIEKNMGDSILLPCSAVAIPDAQLSWTLPSSQMINDLSNSSSGYLLENGTLLIPYSHVGDSGYYRCVAINQQGSDEIVVKVTVNKMVSDRSSKRIKFKKQPGSRTSVRGQVIGDDEGSGDKEIYIMPSKKFHLKNYEQSLKQKSDDIFQVQVRPNKKRKMKLWKGIDRTEEINVAEGRRVFESRRRIHMTNKQINPQHWANILAKVRRKSLPRLTTTYVPLLSTTSEIPFTQWTTGSHLPISSLPPRSAVEINGEESSADTSHLDEAELFSVTIPSVISMQNYNQDQILSSAVRVEHKFSKMPEDPFHMETSVAQEIQFSPTIQTQPWDHSNSNIDKSKVEPKRTEIFNGEISRISKKFAPYTQSTLMIVSNREKVTPNPYSEISVKDPVLTKRHKIKTSKQYLQAKSMSNVSNVAITFTHAEINNSATVVASVAQMTNKYDNIEHEQVIPFNPFTDSKNLILTNVNLEKTKSSTIERTIHPLKKNEWMLIAVTTNKPTTATIITAYERKMSTPEPVISKHSRRRPYGRRRTNRFKRPKPIPPTAFNVEEITFVPKISKLDNTTQAVQSFMAGYQKPEDEIQKLSSSSLMNTATVHKSQDATATSAVQLPTLLPKTPLTLSSVIKDQKSQTVTSSYHSVTTSLPKQLQLSHNPEYRIATENKLPLFEVTNTPTASILGESSTSLFGLTSSVIPELEEKANSFSSDSPNVIDSMVAQSKAAAQQIKVFNSSFIHSSVPLTQQGGKPKIITKMSTILSALAESEVAIPCDATGEPKPLLSWTKISTGATMTAQTKMQRFDVLKNGTLFIHSVQLQDRGQYLCAAENSHGIDKMIVLLTVIAQQPKMLGSRFKDLTVYFGEKVTMDCQATGIPNPHISWIFPNRKIFQTVSTVEGRVMLYENRTLLLKDANFQDRGIYKCIASNAAGADSIAVRLHIAALPPIIEQEKEENFSLNVGQSINIHCSAKAAPTPGIRWVLFDGTQIRPSQFVHGNLFVFPNGTLYIRHVLPKDSGSYECIAANMVGAVRRTVQLQVKKQSTNAKITGSSPQRTDVTYGSTLRLNCSASGDPWPWILWRLPSKRMVDSLQSLDTRIKVLGNGTLVIHSVTDKDAGDYLCMARNKIGDDYVVLKVNVMMKPAKIEHKNENNHKVIYGGDLKVDCVATGLPNPEISWSLPDGSMVNTFMQSDDSGSRAKRYVVFNNGTLYFNEVGLREEGDYTCYAENQIGKDEMKVRVKVVAEPATIRNKTYVILNIPYGDAVSVGCKAKGEPTPKVFWLSPSNRPIPTLSDKYQVYIDGTLLIQKAQRSDSGNYTCVARNSAGEDRKIVWIHVNVQPPKINGHPSTSTSVREMAVKDSRKLIDCNAEGIPSPRVMWAFPEGVILPAPYYGNRITVHRNGTLDIRGVRHTDAVQLVCIGRNEGGEARLVVQLQVVDQVEKPFFGDPVTERITATAGHSINLNCSVHGTPSPRTAWILPNGTELMKSSHLQRFYHKRDGILHISALSAADAGTYRCTARNPGGYVERVVFLKVGVKPEISNRYNNLVSIINGETLQLHCGTQPGQQARVAWTLPNGMVLDSPQAIGRFSLLENGSLIVREASVFDRGTYLCKVATDYGSSLMNVPVIVIAYPPRITSEPAPVIYARPGNTVKLNCMAIGIPKADITWELPEKLHLTTGAQSRLYGNKYLHPQGSLIIQQATQRDAGFYKCTAKNILGSDSKATYIHIF
ncbi:hypothetical protein L345_04938, partial [Ophiophagus hannah]